MPGGLINIVSYGTEDIYLTGNPQITFFKIIYRRFTNFSLESLRINFDDPIGFGTCSSVKIPKLGDLLNKIYLEILLPEINLFRKIPNNNTQIKKSEKSQQDYQIIQKFFKINRQAYIIGYQNYILDNSNTLDILDNISKFYQNLSEKKINIINNFKLILENSDLIFSYPEIAIWKIILLYEKSDKKKLLFAALKSALDKSIKTQKYFFDIYLKNKIKLGNKNSPNIKFAWVDRIGHALLEELEIKIGGNTIDKQIGQYLNIWYELTANRANQDIYYKLIGNIPELTDFNRIPKKQYLLRVPLRFWFCNNACNSIPLVSLQYQDVSLHIKFRKFEQVCYTENTDIFYNNIPDIKLFEIPEITNINISASLLVDYIYLDKPERKLFAKSSHEYLVDQIQIFEKINITEPKIQIIINNFINLSKELIWVAQKKIYTENPTGYNRCRWDNFSLSDNNIGNPIKNSRLEFNNTNRTPLLDSSYFNYITPLENHKSTPSDGINSYAFALKPEEDQPSGAANFGNLKRIVIYMEFENTLDQNYTIMVFSRNINLLRFVSGYAGISYN